MLPWLWLALLLPGAHARRPAVADVPTIDEVVEQEGFTPTPSRSDLYRPGAVLVPNERGGHDEVIGDCIGVDPTVAPMAQSSIAATLSAGVSGRLGVSSAAASAGIEKRLTFIDPEQRTLALGDLVPTESCQAGLTTAAGIRDLSEAVVVHDVLVAIVQNTVCTRADASGGVVVLGQAEAAAWSECVQESDVQVPLGFKAVPLDRVLGERQQVVAVPSGCDFGPIQSVAAHKHTLAINGKTIDVKGPDATLSVASRLRACGESDGAAAFEEWRRRQRQITVAWSIPMYGWLFVPSRYKKAEAARQAMVQALE